MHAIGLIVNTDKPAALELAAQLDEKIERRGIKVFAEKSVADLIGKPELGADRDEMASVDLLIVLGGDGTVLRASRLAGPNGIPMLGVHFGQYGFITQIHPPELEEALDRIFSGNYEVEERLTLFGELERNGEKIESFTALNDIVVGKGPISRMLNLRTFVSGRFITTYAADGIIVSSPTGSTAYSLSAGGPVVNPKVKVIIITPICPHTLNARSLVIPDDESVDIIAEAGYEEEDIMITIDGQHSIEGRCGDKISVRKANFFTRLILLDKSHFYDKLQSRLRWGERFSQ